MTNELRSLTWKYFWQQKFKEVLGFLGIVLLFVLLPFVLGHFVGDNQSSMCAMNGAPYGDVEFECNIFFQWMEGFFYIVVSFMIIFVLYMIISQWISNNWEKAESRARKELEPKVKVKRKRRRTSRRRIRR